jgi:hypothetical protein
MADVLTDEWIDARFALLMKDAPARQLKEFRAFAHKVRALVTRAQRPETPIALISDGRLCWHIPHPEYSVPVSLLKGDHFLALTCSPQSSTA